LEREREMEQDFLGGGASSLPSLTPRGGLLGWGRRGAWRGLLYQPESRRLLLFFLLFGAFALAQWIHGYFSGSLALMALSFHTLFNLMSLGLTLLAMLCTRLPPSPSYSYGYQRLEVLGGFVTAACHCFAGIFIFFEAAEHLVLERDVPHDLNGWRVVMVGLVSAALNLICLAWFQPHRRLTHMEAPGDMDDPSRMVMSTLAVTVATLAVPILIYWGLTLADVLVAVFSATVLLSLATPFARHTGKVLLQTAPNPIRDSLSKSLSEAATYEGVLECRKEHFWALSPNEYVGSFFLRVRQDTDEQVVLAKVTNLFSSFVKHLTIQIEKEDQIYFE